MNRDSFSPAAWPRLPRNPSRHFPQSARPPARAALLGLLVSAAATAAESEPAIYEAPPLVITGVAQHSPLTVVTDPRIPRQPVPASDGTDYLKTIPGFSAVRNGGVNGDPVFRGMFGSRIKLLTNGGEMIGACPNRMDSPASYISPESYDRLTVVKGPQTVLWGPGASAATVRFDRDPERFAELGSRLDASFLAGSNGRFDRRVDAAVGGPEGYLQLLANRSDADDYENGDGDTVASRWDKWSTDLAMGWTPDPDTLLELTLGRGDGEARYAGRAMDGSRFDRESLALRFEKDNLGGVLQKLEAQIYYNYADHVMDNFRLRRPAPNAAMVMMRNPMASNVDRRTLGGRLSGTWRWEDVQLVAGLDGQTSEHRRRQSKYAMMSGVYTDADSFPWETDAGFHNYGAFAELTWYAAAGTRLIGGARLDRSYAEDERDMLKNNMGVGWSNPTAGKERSETLTSGFLRYERDFDGVPATAYVGLGHSERFPDYWELFSATSVMNVPTAFDTIDPEQTTQLDFGIQYQQGPLDAWASAYVGWVRDFILFDYAILPGGHVRTTADNIDARIMGAELGAGYRFSESWKGDASLAWAWGKNSSDDRPLPQIPPLEARLSLTWERGDWSAAALWRVVAAQNRVAENQGSIVARDFDESAGFGVLSVNGAWRLGPRYQLSAGVDNLLDKTYSEHLNLAGNGAFDLPAESRIDEPGRTYWVRLDMHF